METVLLVLTHIMYDWRSLVVTLYQNLVDWLIISASIVIMLDDVDTLKAMEAVKKKNISNKVEERNEMFEAIAATKGHVCSRIWKRYLLVMILGFLIIILEEHLIQCDIISKTLSVGALGITMIVKHKSNKNFDRLKRVKTH